MKTKTKNSKSKNNRGLIEKIRYPAARNHPSLHSAYMFCPKNTGKNTKKNKKSKKRVRYKYEVKRVDECYIGSTFVRISYPIDLNVSDQDYLLTILAIARATDRGKLLKDDGEIKITDDDPELNKTKTVMLDGLNLEGNFIHQACLYIQCTWHELLKESCKGTGKQNYEEIKKSLNKLASIEIFYSNDKEEGKFHIISYYINKKTGIISIAINPKASLSIMGDNNGYILINRKERHLLSSDVAKVLHSILCGLVRPGGERLLSVDKLVQKIWRIDERIDNLEDDDEEEAEKIKSLLRKGRFRLKKAAAEINKLKNWEIEFFGRGSQTNMRVRRQNVPNSTTR